MVSQEIESLVELRHDLHSIAELSGKEYLTRQTILDFFGTGSGKPDDVIEIGDTALILVFRGKESRNSVMFRAEMDALPIPERLDNSWDSKHPGVSHKCGHDGHMAILSGIGKHCSTGRMNRTDVYLLFQPAEETGQGAKAVLEDPGFDIHPDFCFAIHNIPGFRSKNILLKENVFSASVISLIINLEGNTAHAAEPENGNNPALAIAEIINVLDKLNLPDPASNDYFICTPVFIRMGEPAFGVSAGMASLGFTMRCWDNEYLKETQVSLRKILYQIAEMNGLKIQIEWTEEFHANYNHPDALRIVREAAERAGLGTEDLDQPFRWGEDFGFFTGRFKGAMIGIGAGVDTPALHHQDYDFPDDLIGPGLRLQKEILKIIDAS